MVTNAESLEFDYLVVSPWDKLNSHLYTLFLGDPREDGKRVKHGYIENLFYGDGNATRALIMAKLNAGELSVLYHIGFHFTKEGLPDHMSRAVWEHPLHPDTYTGWKVIGALTEVSSVSQNPATGRYKITIDADVEYTNAAPRVDADLNPEWGARRLLVHDITHRLRLAANQFANEMQFYWSSDNATRFWATERQLTSWIAMTREHLAILASGNTAHTVSVEVGVPSDLGRPVHQIPILEALPWMMNQLETMMSEGVLHYFDFHPDVLHSELGISPSKPTYFLWGVDGAGLVSQRMVREIIESDWAATRKFEYAAARRGDPVTYTQGYGEKLHAVALKYDADRLGLRGSHVSVDRIKEWYESWLGYGSKLHQDDEHEDEISLVDSAGTTTKVVAGEHVLAVLARHPDPQALHDAHSTDLAAKLTARELWDMDASGVLTSRVDVAHTSAAWEQLKEQYYDGATTNRE